MTTRIKKETNVVVGVGDLKTATKPDDRLVTFALGSCIGLTVWDPARKVGGLLHYMLPQPGNGEDVPKAKIATYATTGIDLLFSRMSELGCLRRGLVVCAAGAAEVLNDSGVFAIGKRNRTMMRKLLWKQDIVLAAEDTGGACARTMSLVLSTGEVSIRTGAKETTLWST